ncbi:hypothetical protein LXL04_015200 [Taraxacum kok-saghyz]
MEVVNELLKQVVPILMNPISRYLRYMVSCPKYMRYMVIKMKELDSTIVGVEEHIIRNTHMNLEVPAQVNSWLEDVRKIKAKAENVPTEYVSCFNMKIRHMTGRNAFYIIEEIESLMKRHSLIAWNDHPIPLGRVDSNQASTSTLLVEHNDFPSREVTFMEALKALGPNHTSHMVALWGMGGVGKTTMMMKLKETVSQKKMFKYIIPLDIGEKAELINIQKTVASYLGIDLNDKNKSVRAEILRQGFKAKSDGGKTKFFIVLDDVWKSIDLNDIGLSHLPNQGVDFKVLLTSRDKEVCEDMGVKVDSILNMKLLIESEAQSLFYQISEPSDPQLYKIGEKIVRKCGGLPIAIKTMACTLKHKRKDAWNDAVSRLEYHDVDYVNEVFKMSYESLQGEEIKSIFLLCGLYPVEFDIPIEDLVRYGWGLKLFKKVYTIREARNRIKTCIKRLIDTNLLMQSDGRCVKMHDIVLAFVLDMFSKAEQASIVNHRSTYGWPESGMDESSCKRISITCKNMINIPIDLKFPNLSILKLMHGDKYLTFPQDFYREMENLYVVSYNRMKYPLILYSPQCCTNLRVLRLDKCSLMLFNCSTIGNLLNLEVLSFANSGIEWLPSTIGNLKKLRLLDLTNCYRLRIDNGVLKQLVKLEELYMRVVGGNGKAISFTEDNCNEIAELSKNLSALEFQFFESYAQPKHMSFEKLQRFTISVGSYFNEDFDESKLSYENRLLLVTNKGKVLESRINELFEKTEVLSLSVEDINDLGDLISSFYNLRVLSVSECAELRYLLTPGIANNLSKLEHLEVKECINLKELIHTRGSEEEIITFPKLKSLSLSGLPKLLGLCSNVNIIDLPELLELTIECIPEELHINALESLEEIWPCEFSMSNEVKLRVIEVRNCYKLVTMFPCNPMSLLRRLEELIVKNCGSVEVLFNIDLDSIGEIEEGSNLRSLFMEDLGKLKELWRIKGVDNSRLLDYGFQAVESIYVDNCERFRNIFMPITTNFYLGALMKFSITNSGEKCTHNKSTESFQEQEEKVEQEQEQLKEKEKEKEQEQEQTNIISKEVMPQVGENICNVVFQSSLMHSFHNLHELKLRDLTGVDVVFEIEIPTSRELEINHHNQQRLLPCLEELNLTYLHNMSNLWKCNWNRFLILQKQESESSFHNLTTIYVRDCQKIKYLFSPPMGKLLSNLKKVEIIECDGIEEVVSNRDNEDEENTTSASTSTSSYTNTTLFPRFDSLILDGLPNLKCIGGGDCANGLNKALFFSNSTTTTASVDQFKFSQVGGASWTLSQYAREMEIAVCDSLSSLIPCYAVGQMQKLQVLKIFKCNKMKEVFETPSGMNNKTNKSDTDYDERSGIPRLNNVIMVPNLKILNIAECGLLEHIFTFSAFKSLRQLEELSIKSCRMMKVIVKKEEEEEEDGYGEKTKTKGASSSFKDDVVVFLRLKSVTLQDLPEIMGFFLGDNGFRCPSLDYVMIKNCPKMKVFAPRGSTAPTLKNMHTSLGKHSLECGLNFHKNPFPSLFPTTSEGMLWSFHNVIELNVEYNHVMEKIIPSHELLQLQKLEEIYVKHCHKVEEVFEALEAGTNDDSQTTHVKLSNLKQVALKYLPRLKYIWKNNRWTNIEFSNLKTLSVWSCERLEHVFTSSMVGSLLQLQELRITDCNHMEEVIVKDANVEEEEKSDVKMKKIVVLPRIKSIKLECLPRLKAFCLEKVDFSFPLLDTLIIKKCPAITIFTKGDSDTPKLKEIETNFGSYYVQEDINSLIQIKQEILAFTI